MSTIPEKFSNYTKFISFILKYWNSDVFKAASENALNSENFDDSEHDYKNPEELAEDLKNMGPTYVKLGQLLSTRPDLIPEPYLKALESLQDYVEEIPYSEVQKIVEEEIGQRISKAFESFEVQPLASASIGQVHLAVLRSGKKVAVKIQRPGVRKNFIEDLDTLKELTDVAVKHSKTAKKYAVDETLDELRFILLNELDYVKEAENLIALGENTRKYAKIVIPQPVEGYSTSKILTMDYIDGQKITSISPISRIETNYKPLVDELVAAYLKQIIFDGFAHADPHPGNVHLTKDNRIALMDLGMVAKFGPDLRENILKLLIAISKYNGEETANTLLKMSDYDKNADLAGFRKEINRLVLDSQNKTAKDLQTGRLLIQMNKVAAEKSIKLPVELNILGKILMNMDQIVAVLTPDYDLQRAIERNVEKLMQKKMLQELKPDNFFAEALEAKKLSEKLPERLNIITEKLANNEFEIKIDAIDEQRLTDGFQKVANRISIGVIIAALIIGAALLMRIPSNFTILGYPGLAMIFFCTAAVIGLWLVLRMMMKDEDLNLRK
ncbi:ABC1 kinase family protein [Chryseobacterium sp. VAUSW3]|uniref:ABC1 kinase family protein n=1 Tax=Chryseobacterium sp. VAUSW3 TaxID=2010998 RepID=UPI000B4CB0BC|nr:AarF/UbiB family protein [Chryseobacterium sp. VAUSW3]OWR14308.1 ABC transporter [Chryseobacterium sp. VAUSW3]